MQGGSGSASDVIFSDIEMVDVYNPIIIDQNYCDQDEPCEEQVNKISKNTNLISFTFHILNYKFIVAGQRGSSEKRILQEH